MNKILAYVFVFGLFSCQKKEEKPVEKCTPEKKEKKLEMYQMSEMALLMEQMYVDNERVKQNIKNGEAIGEFPEHYMKIYSAKFTDETDNDAFFKQKADEYIAAQRLLYSDTKNVKKNYNASVTACLECHQEKCGGPIPRIKKLYIKD